MKTRPFRWYRDQRLPSERIDELSFAKLCRVAVADACPRYPFDASDHYDWLVQIDEYDPTSWRNRLDFGRETVRIFTGGFRWMTGSEP